MTTTEPIESAAAKDLVTLDSIRLQSLVNGVWVWDEDTTLFTSLSDPPTTGDLANQGYNHVKNFSIPNSKAGRPWKIKGSFGAVGGEWTIKVKVGKNNDPGECTQYEFPFNANSGEFQLEVSDLHLGENDFTWAWVSVYGHAPLSPQGIWVSNPMRVTTG